MDSLDKFLLPFSCKKTGKKPTHTRIGNEELNIHGGSWSIPKDKMESFQELYYMKVFELHKDEYMTEKQNGLCIAIDLDFKYSFETDCKQHSSEDIEKLVCLYTDELKSFFEFNAETKFNVFVMEKNEVNRVEEKQITKDGIHIIIGLKMSHELQLQLRENVLKKIDKIFDLPLINKWEDVLDRGVSAGSVNWQMYGSRKPAHDTYRIQNMYEITYDLTDSEFCLGEIDMKSLAKETLKEYAEMCSVQYEGNLSLPLIAKNEIIGGACVGVGGGSNSSKKSVSNVQSTDSKFQIIKLFCENKLFDSHLDSHQKWVAFGGMLKSVFNDKTKMGNCLSMSVPLACFLFSSRVF
jgi:hypothetical protein